MTFRGSGVQALQWLGLLLLAGLTVTLVYLALTRETAADTDLVRDDVVASTPAPTEQASPTDEPSPVEEVTSDEVPDVPDQRFADFTQGDDLPDRSVVYDSPSNTAGLEVTARGLTHGPVENGATDGLGLVETELKTDVRSLGFRVRFGKGESGSAVLVAWESSALAALEGGAATLPSGMRLVAAPGTWTLSFLTPGGEQVLADGTYDKATGPLEFEVVRDGDDLFVVDPTGLVTAATKTRAGELLGPFASWGLTETGAEQTPAVVESVWAG